MLPKPLTVCLLKFLSTATGLTWREPSDLLMTYQVCGGWGRPALYSIAKLLENIYHFLAIILPYKFGLTLVINTVFILLIAYWNYGPYVDVRLNFKENRKIVQEPYEMDKHYFIICGPSKSSKATFIKALCNLYELVNEFCIDKN